MHSAMLATITFKYMSSIVEAPASNDWLSITAHPTNLPPPNLSPPHIKSIESSHSTSSPSLNQFAMNRFTLWYA